MTLRERVEKLASEIEGGDLGAIRRHLGHDYLEYSPAAGEPPASERVGALVDDLAAALPDMSASLSGLTERDGRVHAALSVTGTHEGELWGVPGSGDRFEWTADVAFGEVPGGLAITFPDLAVPAILGALRALGLVNPPNEMHLPPHNVKVSPPEFLLKVIFTGTAADLPCEHLEQIEFPDPTNDVCEQCVATGDVWPALRQCLMCGFVGCCDTSTNRHAAAHHAETGHPLFRSIRLDEAWMWCYADEAFFEGATLERHRGA